MSEKDFEGMKKLKEAMARLPEDKRGYLIGYAEGVLAASSAPVSERSEKEPA